MPKEEAEPESSGDRLTVANPPDSSEATKDVRDMQEKEPASGSTTAPSNGQELLGLSAESQDPRPTYTEERYQLHTQEMLKKMLNPINEGEVNRQKRVWQNSLANIVPQGCTL